METYESKGLYIADLKKIIIGIKLPKLEAGNKYNIHCIYNISENDSGTLTNKIVLHFSDNFGRALEENGNNIETFSFPSSYIVNVSGSLPIDFTKDISVALFHENDTPDRVIEQRASEIFENAKDGTCNKLDICSINPKNPKTCGMGTIKP